MSLKLGIAAVWGSQSTTKQEVFHYETTGVIRKLDELGRITLPIELRRSLNLDVKDALEITVQDDCIILKKAANTDIFTGGTEDLVEYEGKKVSKASILALAKLAGLKLAE
ncbi:AbrB/MazE/SpoVT family DNA-binding domain-containing protein [Clostridium sp. OM04-12AA]|nr:AbrB/MazE/SpoVT family DNA-binding domain-containing protein [Clostridium sp. OM04-12AA]